MIYQKILEMDPDLEQALDVIEELKMSISDQDYKTLMESMMRVHNKIPKGAVEPKHVMSWDDPLMAEFIPYPITFQQTRYGPIQPLLVPTVVPEDHTPYEIWYGTTKIVLFYRTIMNCEKPRCCPISRSEAMNEGSIYHYRTYMRQDGVYQSADYIINPTTGIMIRFYGSRCSLLLQSKNIPFDILRECLTWPDQITSLVPHAQEIVDITINPIAHIHNPNRVKARVSPKIRVPEATTEPEPAPAPEPAPRVKGKPKPKARS